MKFLRTKDLEDKLGIKKSKIYLLIESGDLPKPIKVGRASIWLESEINEAFQKIIDEYKKSQGGGGRVLKAKEIYQILGGRIIKGGYLCHCPSHNDKIPSLSVRDLNHRTVIHCFAGCETKDILNELNNLHETKSGEYKIRAVCYYYQNKEGEDHLKVTRVEDRISKYQ